MPKLTFNAENADLFEKIIKIVRYCDPKYGRKYYDDFEATKLIMKEIEEWLEGVSIITPLCKGILLGDDNAGEETFYDTKRFKR